MTELLSTQPQGEALAPERLPSTATSGSIKGLTCLMTTTRWRQQPLKSSLRSRRRVKERKGRSMYEMPKVLRA